MVDLFAKYGITKEEVLNWAKGTKYEGFVSNPSFLAQIYLQEKKGQTLDETDVVPLSGTKVDVSQVNTKDLVIIEVIVGKKLRETTYLGCPNCYKSLKVKDSDEIKDCPDHGAVEPKLFTWRRYVAADNSADLVISVPPRFNDMPDYADLFGRVMKMKGKLNDQGEFNIVGIQEISPETAKAEEAKAPIVQKAQEMVDEKELADFMSMLGTFPSMAKEDLKKWHEYQKVKTPLDVLIAKGNAEEFDEGNVRKIRIKK
jgi:hypothetical protein